MNKSPEPKPSVLIVESFPEPDPTELKVYVDWLTPFFEVHTIYIKQMTSTDVAADAVVITGSRWQLASDPVPELITKLILETTKPVLAICWGHQVLAHAWGAKIIRKAELIERSETVHEDRDDDLLDELGLFFTIYASHYEHVVKGAKLKKNFHILAHSNSCEVEAIRHKSLPQWGVQFHPERSGDTGRRLARNFARMVREMRGGK